MQELGIQTAQDLGELFIVRVERLAEELTQCLQEVSAHIVTVVSLLEGKLKKPSFTLRISSEKPTFVTRFLLTSSGEMRLFCSVQKYSLISLRTQKDSSASTRLSKKLFSCLVSSEKMLQLGMSRTLLLNFFVGVVCRGDEGVINLGPNSSQSKKNVSASRKWFRASILSISPNESTLPSIKAWSAKLVRGFSFLAEG